MSTGRMYDWLLAERPRGPVDLRDSLEGLHGRLLQSRVVVADNVADQYFRDHLQAPDVEGVPLAPPFPSFFIEMKGSRRLAPDDLISSELDLTGLVGDWHLGGLIEDVTDVTLSDEMPFIDNVRWRVLITLFMKRQGKRFEHVGGAYFGLDERGFLDPSNMYAIVTDEEYKVRLEDETIAITQKGHMFGIVQNVRLLLRAVAFMHCKNVERERLDPNPKLSRSFRKKHGVPLTSYYVLRVTSVNGRGTTVESSSEDIPEERRLHICRGHFKTFTEAKPLFGRYTGTYWWPQTLRGTEAKGAVFKDYEISERVGLTRG